MEHLLLEMAKEWGPWVIVAFLLWKCVQRQEKREDRLSEVIAASATAMQSLASSIERLRQSPRDGGHG